MSKEKFIVIVYEVSIVFLVWLIVHLTVGFNDLKIVGFLISSLIFGSVVTLMLFTDFFEKK